MRPASKHCGRHISGLQVVFEDGAGFERPTLRSLRTAAGGRTALRQLFRVLPDAAESTGRPLTNRRASVALPVAPTTIHGRPSTVLDGEGVVQFEFMNLPGWQPFIP